MASVLLVDDDQLSLRILSDMLVRAGFETTCYANPIEALSAVEHDRPDVIVADFLMPQVNGIAFLELSVNRSPGSARFLCTAHRDSAVAIQAVNVGQVHRIILKPVEEVEFVSAVKQASETAQLRRRNEELAEELRRQNLHLEAIVRERTEALLHGFVASLDARDSGTQWHSQRVAKYTRRLAIQVGIGDPELTVIERGALLHDIGKMGIPDYILLKNGPLSGEEWQAMRRHPELGWALLQEVDYLREASGIVLHHHERWDGKGYPSGISGDQIVIGARLFQVIDAYDAMTTDRPYRRRVSQAEALGLVAKEGGAQFDPMVVRAFLSVPDEEWLEIRSAVDLAAARDGANPPKPPPALLAPSD